MSANDVIQIFREGVYVLLLISAPALVVALVVGVVVSLFQALTQIQEQTLTFVPKLVALLLVLVLAMPFMLERLTNYTESLFERVANIE